MRIGGWDTVGDKATQILTVQEHMLLRRRTAYTAFAHNITGRHREKMKASWEEKVAKTLREGRRGVNWKYCKEEMQEKQREHGGEARLF